MSRSSNYFKYLLALGVIDFANDDFNIILMQPGFAFDRAAHQVYADVIGSEHAAGTGYTTGGQLLTGVGVDNNATHNATIVTWNNPAWTAAGGSIITSGAIIYDDTIDDPAIDPIVGYINFNGTLTIIDGGTFTIANVFAAIRDRTNA